MKIQLKEKEQGSPQKFHSEAFKKMVAAEFEKNFLNKDQIQREYNTGSNDRVLE
ncbi:MAG: hypothetical protein AB7S54_01265 [Bacteroidales bacterium]